MEQFNKGKIDTDSTLKMQKQILIDEIDDPEFLEFAIEYLTKINQGYYW